jgi:hypothetical protein
MRCRGLARAVGLLGIVLAVDQAVPVIAWAAEPSAAGEVQDLLQISSGDRRRLGQGEVVSYPVTENSERELAAGMAMLVPVPFRQVADYLASGQLITQDTTIVEFGMLANETPAASLAGARYTGGERGEAESFLEASPGTHFNLSVAEIEALRVLKDSSAGSRVGAVEKASAAYARILGERLEAYRRAGLGGIAPYARNGGSVRDPAIDLRSAAGDAERLGRYGQVLAPALLRYPADASPQMANSFYWIKRRIQRRPHLSLLHRMVVPGSGAVLHVERYYYAGHSFNATEILTGALAHPDGTLVFSTSRTSTDEVLGMGNQFKRTIGRSQMRDEIRARLDRLRASFSRPTTTVESP